MALDGAFLYTIRQELSSLIGGRVEKIYQPSREEIIITFRSLNRSHVKVLLNAAANSARIHVTENEAENPKQPPMFCMLLRKHLNGGKLLALRQDGLERILWLDFEATNEMGDLVRVTLAMEIMGRCSNIILLRQEEQSFYVIDAIKRVNGEMSRERTVLPGMLYTLPPREQRMCLLHSEREELRGAISAVRNDELPKCLIRALEGISPIFARECAFYAARDSQVKRDDLTENDWDRLLFYLGKVKQDLLTGGWQYTAVLDKANALKDFSFVEIHQYGALMATRPFDSASALLDFFYRQRDQVNRMKQRAHDLLKMLLNTTERIGRRLALQQQELKDCQNREEIKLWGDLLSANLYQIEKGMSSIRLENFYAPENTSENPVYVEIPLDVRLSPSQNAQKYYADYRKAQTAQEKLTELIARGKEELQYIDSVFDALTRSTTDAEVLELKAELAEQGYLRANKWSRQGKALSKIQPPMVFTSSDGFSILVGRNNRQNDQLTLKTADKTDLWLHTQNIPGSHVIVQAKGRQIPDRTIEEAAVIAACNSKARDSAQVPVDYTQVRYVKKPAGAKPGMVIFTNYQTAYVTPDAERIASLRK